LNTAVEGPVEGIGLSTAFLLVCQRLLNRFDAQTLTPAGNMARFFAGLRLYYVRFLEIRPLTVWDSMAQFNG
jgi:hypothetical protein